MALVSLLGDTLVKNDGTEIKTSELSTKKGGVVGLYFSAHWCPPCRGFTPKLASIYNEIKEQGKDFEIVFISWDNNNEQFTEYHKEMPWLAIPFSKSTEKTACGEKYEVDGIPSLTLLEADTGDTITTDGRSPISEFGADGFPFTKERLEVAKKEILEKKEKLLKEMADLKFLGNLATINGPKDFDLQDIARNSEALAFAFMNGSGCQGSDLVLPKLLDIQRKLGAKKLSVVIIPMGKEDEEFPSASREKMEGIPMVPFDRAPEVAKKFEGILQEIDAPHVFIIDAREESSMKILAENAARSIYFKGEALFPWSDEALAAREARVAKLKAELPEKKKNLEFFNPSEDCHIVDKQGNEIALSTLQSKDVVGIYFSGHWCGPCRKFTPKLEEVYNKCKESGKSFEVVFISSDRDQAGFDEYYSEMPWCTLKYEDRDLKEAISDLFGVEGIPHLVLLKGDGTIICEDGRSAVSIGEDYFPWTEESIERGKKEEPEREAKKAALAKEEEEKIYREQDAAGKIVVRRHRGEITDIKIGIDHSVKFDSFSTVAAPNAVLPSGKKAWYEVTFHEGSGLSQVGWATSAFATTDEYSGDGVGDCSNSYGFDGQRQCKWHDGSTSWGAEFQPKGDRVLGVAADMQNGKVIFGLDGNWEDPMGIAFEDLDTNLSLFPVITGQGIKISLNFGDSDMKYGPPDDTFEKVKDVVGK